MDKDRFRDYINKKHGSCFRTQEGFSSNNVLDSFRNELIESLKDQPPAFMVSVSYWKATKSLNTIRANNKRFNSVLNDLFSPQKKGKPPIASNYFIEPRADKLKKITPVRVKNTITDSYEFDWATDIDNGYLDTHTLVGHIPDSVIEEPRNKILAAYETLYSRGYPPKHLIEEDGYPTIKMDLMEYTLRRRCKQFIGTSKQCLNIRAVDDSKSYDGFPGWIGLVAYVTKKMTTPEAIALYYDHDNSSIKYNRS